MPIDAGHVNALGTERISKLIIRYSMPTMLSTVVNASYNVADRIFVGRMCGEDALAAITVCFSPTLFLLAVAMTIGHGSATMISICLGAGKREAAEKFLSCLLGFIIGQDAGGDRSCYQYERGYDSHQFESNN